MLRRLLVSTTIAALAAGLSLVATARADWPVYGHDLANTRSAGTNGPSVADAAALRQAWKFTSSHGDFTGTPVVAGGVLVAGTNLGTVYALDPASGKVRWTRDIGQPINGSAAIDLHAPGGATAFVPIAQQGNPQLVGLSLATGALRWRTHLSTQPSSANADVYGSPAFWRGTVYIGTSGPNGDGSTARGSVVALDEASGAVRWISYTVPPGHDGGAVWSTPAIDTATHRLYVGTGNAYHEPAADTTDAVLVLNALSGRLLGHYQATPDDTFASDNPAGPDADFGASPNLLSGPTGQPLVGEGQKSGVYWALDPATMRPVWHTTVGPSSPAGGITASTAYDGARIFGTDSLDGQVWALGRDGAQAWASADPSTLDFAPVAVAHGVLYSVDSGGFLVARDASSGAPLTTQPLGSPSFGGISVVADKVFVAVGTGPPPGSQDDSNGAIIAFTATAANAQSALALADLPIALELGRGACRSCRLQTDERAHAFFGG
jgi:polyvinyl alcohol dehydrogenase (cytochrome)